MQLYSIDSTYTKNTEEICDYISNKSKYAIFKERVVRSVKATILYTILFVITAVPLLLEGIYPVEGKIVFDPSLVVKPAFNAMLSVLGIYIAIEVITHAFTGK